MAPRVMGMRERAVRVLKVWRRTMRYRIRVVRGMAERISWLKESDISFLLCSVSGKLTVAGVSGSNS